MIVPYMPTQPTETRTRRETEMQDLAIRARAARWHASNTIEEALLTPRCLAASRPASSMLSALRNARPAVTRCASHIAVARTPARTLARSIAAPRSILFTPRRQLIPAAPCITPLSVMTSRSLTQRSAASKDAADSDVVAASVTAPAARSSDRSDAADDDDDDSDSSSSDRFWFVIAGLSGGLAVCLGAFGAHGLKARVSSPYFLEIWQTAAHYHLVHALAIGLAPVVVGALVKRRVQRGQSVGEALRANLFGGGKQRGSKFIADATQRAKATAAILRLPRRNWAASCFLAGTVVFSGSLYALTLTENKKFGAITPLGGAAFILGWLFLALGL